MPFFAEEHVRRALAYLPAHTHPSLISFLAMLRDSVPVSATPTAPFGGRNETDLMSRYFSPAGGPGDRPFYIPFGAPRANSTFWKRRDHGGSSLQRQRTGKGWVYRQGRRDQSGLWSLTPDLPVVLEQRHTEFVGTRPISIHNLAAWCYRQQNIADHDEAIGRFIDEFHLAEYDLVGTTFTHASDPTLTAVPFSDVPLTDGQVYVLLSPPPPDSLRAELARLADGTRSADVTEEPPAIPRQEVGLHFEINDQGVVDFVPPAELDSEGNNVRRLRRLHPALLEMVAALIAALAQGNAPHAMLLERCRAYQALIAQDLEAIDFARLYVEGVRLANAGKATAEQIREGELPGFRKEEREALDSLLDIHGTFIMSTGEGMASVAQERRYKMRPTEELGYREVAVSFARDLQDRPDIAAPEVASLVLGAAEQIGHGDNPERSGTVGTNAVRNITIALAAGAAVAALPLMGTLTIGPAGVVAGGAAAFVASESLKKSKHFSSLAAHLGSRFDRMAETDFVQAIAAIAPALRKHLGFLLANQQRLRSLANEREAFSWLHALLDWIASGNHGGEG